MRVAVCLKQVPDTGDLRIDPETNTLIREGVEAVLNPLDEFPLEAGLQLAETTAGTVTVFTMGPPAADEVLRKAVAMGAGEAVHCCDRKFAGADTWATSLTLAKAIQKLGPFDLILCGKQAVDGDTAQVGPGIAAHLGIAQVTYVTAVKPGPDQGTVVVERLLDNETAVIEVSVPAVLTVLKEANEPRLPTLTGRIDAISRSNRVVTADELGLAPEEVGLDGSPTRVVKIAAPKLNREHRRLAGDAEAVARQLLEILAD